MKKYITIFFFVFFLVFFSNNLFSQTAIYKPFPLDHGMWVVERYGPTGPVYGSCYFPSCYSFARYQANGDTIIGGFTYKKVVGAYAMGGTSYGSDSFVFAYRNDIPNKKVYIYANQYDINKNGFNKGGQYKDTLWYDFNLSIGDTLKSSYSLYVDPNDAYKQRAIVSSIDSVLICGIYHKQFGFCGGRPNTSLIEGVGFKDNVILTVPDCPFEPVYLYETEFSCSLASVNEPTTSLQQPQIFPNPALNTLQINYPNPTMTLSLDYFISDCLGKIIISGTLTNNQSIDISKLENGLYFITGKIEEKNFFQEKFVKQ